MFVRKKHNKGGSTSVLVVDKAHNTYKIFKNFGYSYNEIEISSMVSRAEAYILEKMGFSLSLFSDEEDILITEFVSSISNSQIQLIGPELIFGSLYDHIGYKKIDNAMFRYLVLSRLASPVSKLKTIDYLYRFQGVSYSIDKIYRFLDNLWYIERAFRMSKKDLRV